MRDDICREASRLIQCVMEGYIPGNPKIIRALLVYFSSDVLVIGTGRHKFYTSLEALARGLEKDQEGARDIRFVVQDAWYEAKMIMEDTCVAYGEFKAREAGAGDKGVTIDMDTRIMAGVHREKGRGLVIDSSRQSVPYIYQQEGEYYPKAFASLVEEALKRSAILEEYIQLDSMTGLYNRKYTETRITHMLSQDWETGLLSAIDMDDFKKINDIYEYLEGNELLKKTVPVVAEHVPPSAVVGRVGGNEFMMFLPGPYDRELGEKAARGLIREISRILSQMKLEQSCPVSIAAIYQKGETLEHAYRRADQALYCAKSLGKNTFCWAEDSSLNQSCTMGTGTLYQKPDIKMWKSMQKSMWRSMNK